MQNKIDEILTSKKHFHINLGLDRISAILNFFGNPQDKLKFIHVAGTNGKGSVCEILNTILQKNNFKTGLFTSPHIFEYNERIKINNKPISDDVLENLIKKIINLSEEKSIELTEFEILTISAFLYFEKNNVDIVILETGLGGRFDATNVIKNNLCAIITHLDLEHTDILGNTIDKIAFEKGGIIKENCPVIISEKSDVIENISKEKNSKLYYAKLINKVCSLKGEHQNQNVSLALKACEILNIEVKDEYLKEIKNPCRFEFLKEYNILVDVAHNPNGINALMNNLKKYYPNQKYNFIFGCLNTKDYRKMLSILDGKIFIYEFSHPKSCSYEELSKVRKVYKFSDYKKDENLTVICGSFYMLKELFNDMHIKYNINS